MLLTCSALLVSLSFESTLQLFPSFLRFSREVPASPRIRKLIGRSGKRETMNDSRGIAYSRSALATEKNKRIGENDDRTRANPSSVGLRA